MGKCTRKMVVIVTKLVQSIENGLNCVGDECCRTDGSNKILDKVLTVVFKNAIIRMFRSDTYG
jgi:hypothetical protein